jgi:hypothetical protein
MAFAAEAVVETSNLKLKEYCRGSTQKENTMTSSILPDLQHV